jgi:hypothetical protein
VSARLVFAIFTGILSTIAVPGMRRCSNGNGARAAKLTFAPYLLRTHSWRRRRIELGRPAAFDPTSH